MSARRGENLDTGETGRKPGQQDPRPPDQGQEEKEKRGRYDDISRGEEGKETRREKSRDMQGQPTK